MLVKATLIVSLVKALNNRRKNFLNFFIWFERFYFFKFFYFVVAKFFSTKNLINT